MGGIYWGLVALHLLRHPDALPRAELLDFVVSCYHNNGGLGAAPDHDPHLLYTLYGVQILAMLDAFDDFNARVPAGTDKIAHCKFSNILCVVHGSHCNWQYYPDLASLQDRSDGSFQGDTWGEKDTRFLYAALNGLSLLQKLDLIDLNKAVEYVQSCANFDGGYGTTPGAESHSGQVLTCIGALTIAGRLDLVDRDKLGGWLSERQLKNGGLNGRPEKLEDVCYSWWVMSSLAMIDRLHWIDGERLAKFILNSQVCHFLPGS